MDKNERERRTPSPSFLKIPILLLQIGVAVSFLAAFAGYAIQHSSDAAQISSVSRAFDFFVSAGAGSLSALVPVLVALVTEKAGSERNSAALALLDAVKAEVYKFALLAVMTGCFFKFTDYPAAPFLCAMCVMIFSASALRARGIDG